MILRLEGPTIRIETEPSKEAIHKRSIDHTRSKQTSYNSAFFLLATCSTLTYLSSYYA